MNQDPKNFERAIARLADDQQPMLIEISKFEAWCLLSAVQLALRHPQYKGPSRQIVENVAEQIARPLIANDRELTNLYSMGQQPRFDQ